MTLGVLLLGKATFAQKFGDIPLKDLTMKVYEQDSTANAVILFDKGEFDGNQLQFKRHLRVKILKKSGLDWGNWVFDTPDRGNFRVVVVNLENGIVQKTKATGESIYTEDIVDNFKVTKVFAPNVKVGSVIDIMYSHFGVPLEWRFQEKIPVVSSHLIMGLSKYITFNRTFYGFEQIETIAQNEWKATNMPAFKEEPYLNSYKNYITKFEFQPMPALVDLSWQRINEHLMGSTNFGGVIRRSNFLDDYAEELRNMEVTEIEKVQLAYDYIRKNIKWNGIKTIWCSPELRGHFTKDHSGSVAEINLTLVSLLGKIGVNAFPMALSTRDNGILVHYAPSYYKMNYVIAYVQLKDQVLTLDATDQDLPMGILPKRCLNASGIVVEATGQVWKVLNQSKGDYSNKLINVEIHDDLSVDAHVTQQFKNYSFVDWFRNQDSDPDEAYIHGIEEKFGNITVSSYEIKANDKDKMKCTELLDMDIAENLLDLGSEVIFNPIVLFDYQENPFKSDERKYPLDLVCSKNIKTTIAVAFPQHLTLKSLPESIKLSNADGSAIFTYFASSNASGLQFKVNLKITKSVFTESEYFDLKQFFTEVIKKINEPVEFQKT